MAASDEEFRSELIEAVASRLPDDPKEGDWQFAFTCEVADRLTQAEEFRDFIPATISGTGSKGRRIRCDGYEFDEADDSLHLVISDFAPSGESQVLTKTRLDSLFAQLSTFVEDSLEGRKPTDPEGSELAGQILGQRGGILRYRLYVLSDAQLSDRVTELPSGEIDGITVEYRVWDLRRLLAVSQSAFGAEQFSVDFTQFVPGGLPCLAASESVEIPPSKDQEGLEGEESKAQFRSYLCVIPGKALAELYDQYGSKLLEGNVRSYLGVSGKINKEIQGTIRARPERFFIYNNGVSATATDASVIDTSQGPRLVSARYLQVVNGGQTTASLHAARRKDSAKLDGVFVQMKLTVVTANSVDTLDDIIQSISKYSNKQNKVADADFFSSHPYHRAIERLSRRIHAPAAVGIQNPTYWFYERARGQYGNAQSALSQAERRKFLRDYPKAQLISKTDLAKFENSWRQMPHVVSLGAQKNFAKFAEYVGREWGEDGARFDNDIYFQELIARAILFKSVEKIVSAAEWYEGGYRANIVTYTIGKLACMIERQKPKHGLDFKKIWSQQAISEALQLQLESIAKEMVPVVTSPPVSQMNITEWCKKEACWNKAVDVDIRIMDAVASELLAPDDVLAAKKNAGKLGQLDAGIAAVSSVLLKGAKYWSELHDWSRKHSPIFGMEVDLVRSMAKPGWIPSPKQAVRLDAISRRLESEGFKAT